MCFKINLFLIYLSILINSVISVEDLLDKYVNHVDLVNSYNSFRPKRDVSEFNSDVNLNKRDLRDFVPWTHSQTLDQKGHVILRWQPRHQEILFRVEAKTKGYVGIGFSPNGGMEGADILIGGVNDNDLKPYLMVKFH